MRPLALLVGALALKAASGRPARRRHAVAVIELAPIALPPVSVPAVAVGTFALGTLAIGALAIGTLAIGALAIGRLEIRKARLREVEIDSLTVGHLKVIEEVAGEPTSAASRLRRGETMELRTASLVVIILAALSLSVGIGHLMQLPARMGWDQYLGGVDGAGRHLRAVRPARRAPADRHHRRADRARVLLRRHGAAGFAFTAAAAVMFAIGLLIWWILVSIR